jgi:hypothetical protein
MNYAILQESPGEFLIIKHLKPYLSADDIKADSSLN